MESRRIVLGAKTVLLRVTGPKATEAGAIGLRVRAVAGESAVRMDLGVIGEATAAKAVRDPAEAEGVRLRWRRKSRSRS